MVDHLRESENIITDLINSDFGAKYSLASKIEDIEELPINDFSTIQKLLSSGEAIIRMAPVSIDGTTFNIISTPFGQRGTGLNLGVSFFICLKDKGGRG